MHYTYQTEQTCSEQIDFDIVDGKLHNVSFLGGCHGNLQGVSRLVEGMDVFQVIDRLEGIRLERHLVSRPALPSHPSGFGHQIDYNSTAPHLKTVA